MHLLNLRFYLQLFTLSIKSFKTKMHSAITAVQNSHKYSFKKQELQFCYTVYFPPAILIVLCIHLNISIGFMFYCLYCSNYVGYVTVRFLLGTINYYCTNLDFLQGSFICTLQGNILLFFSFFRTICKLMFVHRKRADGCAVWATF